MNPLRLGFWMNQDFATHPRPSTNHARLWLRRRLAKLATRRRALRLLQLSPLFTEVDYRCSF